MKFDPFVGAILVAIISSYIFPISSEVVYRNLNIFSSIGISIIFFLYGLKIKLNSIKSGLANWRLHLLIQVTTFLIFPLLVFIFLPFFQESDQYIYWVAFMFLAAVPSTVSSSVVMVNIAKGNVTSAIFNASISGILGIVITPLWLDLIQHSNGVEVELTFVYKSLFLEILLPILIGLTLQKWGHSWVVKNSKWLSLWDKLIILIIVFKSFSYSFYNKLFENVSWQKVLIMFCTVVVLFFVVFLFLRFVSKILGFNKEDQITAQFCGTKKSLVHGTVFSNAIFGTTPYLGIILLPLMIYHALQILIIGYIANQLAKRKS